MAAEGRSTQFIQDVINFIDKPLSPGTLSHLRKSAKAHREGSPAAASPTPARAAPAAGVPLHEELPVREMSPLALVFPLGAKIETQHLANNTEFNGLRGVVVGHATEKVLIEFEGGAGQVFDIPSYNLRVVNPADLLPPSALPVPVLDSAVAVPVPVPAPAPAPSQDVVELQSKLRMAMSFVEAAKDALLLAADLYQTSPNALIDVVAEFQPALPRDTIDKNWVKIVKIYQDQAATVATAAAPAPAAPAPPVAALPAALPAPVYGAAPAPAPMGDVTMSGGIQGVLDFIDKPLSPSTLKDVRKLRQSLSPKRDR
eukprot:TRINITY_DN12301_c0_g1_i1.p1 TRINITY_DN12301_c0_g1~~TRINITY_DN12301_c0_g1_i1.p1  ORF type:complete len:314 (+),score=123.96 TRINITY_DN12301_c0_g1_i1:88-1029(+)